MAFGPVRRRDSVALLEMRGVSSRAGYYRFDVLDQDLDRIGEVDVVRSGAKIRNDSGRKIKRTLSGFEVDPVAAAELDTIGARIQPVHVLEDGSEWPLGVFLFVDASRRRRRSGLELAGSLHDGLFALDQESDKTIGFGRGRNISSALEQVAQRFGIRRFRIDGTAKNIGAPIAWPAGSTKGLDIMEELGAMAGFLSPYMDNAGLLIHRAAPTPADGTAELRYVIGPDGRIVADSPVESDDLLEAPNLFIVIDGGATTSPIVGSYELPESSPISIARRGFAVSSTRTLQGLEDTAAATAAARRDAAESSAGFRLYTFDAIPDFRHDTFDLVEYRPEGHDVLCRETSWELELDPTALMSHELREFYQ